MLKTVVNQTPGVCIRHEVPVPPLCPVSGNPASGLVSIAYTPNSVILDVMTLTNYIASFVGSETHRDLELVSRAIRDDAQKLLDVPVAVLACYELIDGQRLIVEDK
jgi:NADPH-dependent 7-cyano-7-deazaguanine reductase QueF